MKNSRILILLLLLTGLFGALATGGQVYIQLFYLGALISAASWIWGRLTLKSLRLSRSSRALRANVGDIYEEYYEIENGGKIPCPWVEVYNEAEIPASSGSRVLVNIKKGEKRSYLARTWLTQRGAFPLGPTALIAQDPLGLFKSKKIFSPTAELIILPMLVQIESFPVKPGLLPGGKALRQKALGITPHAAGVREYAPGDALRRIHWASSARRQELMVKEFDQDPQAEAWIFLDAEEDAQASRADEEPVAHWDGWAFGKKPESNLPPSTLEYGVTIAASLTRYFIRERRSVGFATSGQTHISIPPDLGSRQEEKVLEALAFVKSGPSLPLESIIRAQAGQMLGGSSAILITASTKPELLVAVSELQRRNLYPTVVLLDAASFGGSEGSVTLVETLKSANIPVCLIACGADLSAALSNFL